MDDWKSIDSEVTAAFEDGSVLHADRATLDRWLVALTGRTHTYMRKTSNRCSAGWKSSGILHLFD